MEFDLKKIDDTGKPIANATYSLYVADSSYAIQQDTPVFTGITDTKGNISVDPNVNTDLTLAALRAKSKYYVLKEEQAPAGYQKAADVHLNKRSVLTRTAKLIITRRNTRMWLLLLKIRIQEGCSIKQHQKHGKVPVHRAKVSTQRHIRLIQ